jgi:GNAT superfamily N-acetyltransferase
MYTGTHAIASAYLAICAKEIQFNRQDAKIAKKEILENSLGALVVNLCLCAFQDSIWFMTVTRPIHILQAAPTHVDAMVNVQRIVYEGSKFSTDPDTLFERHFYAQIAAFPEGQFIAVDGENGLVVGHTSGMLFHFDESKPFTEAWVDTTGYGMFTTHKPDGEWMYGAETAVLPDYQGRGVGSRLMEARFDLCHRLNLRGMVAGSVIMDYHRYSETLTPEDYVKEVVAGRIFDTNLSKQMKKGFHPHNLMQNYVSDKLSLGWGVAIVWHNPDFQENA